MGDHVQNALFKLEKRRAVPLPAPDDVATVKAALEDFIVSVLQGTPVAVDGHQGLRALEVVMACRLSSDENRPVKIAELASNPA